tara:strand:- start:1471 stop:2757 length:1287 start_codon:yes stop_codon:yes gene_type:complete
MKAFMTCKLLSFKLLIISFSLLLSFFNSYSQEADRVIGKKLFNSYCASCHKVNKRAVGPALRGVSEKYDREWLYSWIKNSSAMIKSGDAQAISIWEEYNKSVMTAFPQLSNVDIDNIIAYTDYIPPVQTQVNTSKNITASKEESTFSNTLILSLLVLVFLILLIMLILVNKTLQKIALSSGVELIKKQIKEDRTPIWIAFAKNEFIVVVSSIMLLLSSAYFVYDYLMQVGVDQGYMPIQPIHYSHKIHSGDNKIDCKYCHSSARISKHSGIPSLNVCMNCHMYIAEYNGEEDLENGYTKDFYTKEIKKLYSAVGWDEETQKYTGKVEPVKWIRIHNLPDFAYFNHAQHVEVGKIACQKCHGPVEDMEILYQFSPLTMGWCINCHRESNIKVESNEYYSKIHEQLSKKYGVEKLTVAQMGGLECGKCHY